MSKRGISPLISLVLLVGITFVVGLVVFSSGIDIINILTKEETPNIQQPLNINEPLS